MVCDISVLLTLIMMLGSISINETMCLWQKKIDFHLFDDTIWYNKQHMVSDKKASVLLYERKNIGQAILELCFVDVLCMNNWWVYFMCVFFAFDYGLRSRMVNCFYAAEAVAFSLFDDRAARGLNNG